MSNWNPRFDVVSIRIEHLQACVGDIIKPELEQTMRLVLACLQAFMQTQRAFFEKELSLNTTSLKHSASPADGEISDAEASALFTDTGYFVFNELLDQVECDIALFERIIMQRSCAHFDHEVLEMADRLAGDALLFSKNAGLLDCDTVAITYLHKQPQVRVLPYAPVTFVGMPVSTGAADAKGYLSIPHEIGHTIFWRTSKTFGDGRRLRELADPAVAAAFLADQFGGLEDDSAEKEALSQAINWLEEIWCDLFGGLLGKKAMTRSAELLAAENTPNNLYNNDNDHPFPAIRPITYFKLAALTGKSNSDQANWLAALDARRKPGKATSRLTKAFRDEFIVALETVASALWNEFSACAAVEAARWSDCTWSTSLGSFAPTPLDGATYKSLIQFQESSRDCVKVADDDSPTAPHVMGEVNSAEIELKALYNVPANSVSLSDWHANIRRVRFAGGWLEDGTETKPRIP